MMMITMMMITVIMKKGGYQATVARGRASTLQDRTTCTVGVTIDNYYDDHNYDDDDADNDADDDADDNDICLLYTSDAADE